MKKVLLISYHFPPLNMIASKRYGLMCKYFEEYGYKPYIITTRHDRNCGLDVRLDLEVPVKENQIIRIGRINTNSQVSNIYSAFLLQLMKSLKISSRTITPTSIGWYEKVRKAINLEELQDISIIIGTFPPMENLFVAKYLSKKLKCPYIAEIRDLISDYTEADSGYKRSILLDKILEAYVLRGADGIVTVTPGFRDLLKERFPEKSYKVIFNAWDKKREKGVKDKKEKKYLYYAGSLYLHRLESFELLIKCLKKINMKSESKIHFIVRSIGPKSLDVKAKKLIRGYKVQDYVSILPAMPEDCIKEEQKYAYINVVLSAVDEKDKALMTTIPGKVFELLNMDAPVLAIASGNSDISRILNNTNKGVATTSENDIIEFILKESEKFKGNNRIQNFSRKKQAKKLCTFLDEVLGESV